MRSLQNVWSRVIVKNSRLITGYHRRYNVFRVSVFYSGLLNTFPFYFCLARVGVCTCICVKKCGGINKIASCIFTYCPFVSPSFEHTHIHTHTHTNSPGHLINFKESTPHSPVRPCFGENNVNKVNVQCVLGAVLCWAAECQRLI